MVYPNTIQLLGYGAGLISIEGKGLEDISQSGFDKTKTLDGL